MIDRRSLIGQAALLSGALFAPRITFAKAATERRLLFVIQRGAADGLATLAPMGDPTYAKLRGELGEIEGATKLDGMFALHPALKQLGALYSERQALFVHACGTPYRDRSHFDGQNVLESGGTVPYAIKDGWLNRLLTLLPAESARALAIAATVPMALRGDAPVSSYAPSALPEASDDLLARVGMLYASDPQLHPLWEEALQTRAMAGDLGKDNGRGAAAAGQLVAQLMSGPEGARIAMVETGGWDTHAGQKARLNVQLTGLDAMLGAVKTGLGAAWADTLVIVATEFGRTAAANGTGGTDHGTAALAMLAGGTVKGGRVLADWPGLGPSQLYEGRDLKPTTPLESLIAGAIAGHFALDPALAMRTLFAESRAPATAGLIA